MMCVVRRLATPVALTDTNAHSMIYAAKMNFIQMCRVYASLAFVYCEKIAVVWSLQHKRRGS